MALVSATPTTKGASGQSWAMWRQIISMSFLSCLDCTLGELTIRSLKTRLRILTHHNDIILYTYRDVISLISDLPHALNATQLLSNLYMPQIQYMYTHVV